MEKFEVYKLSIRNTSLGIQLKFELLFSKNLCFFFFFFGLNSVTLS